MLNMIHVGFNTVICFLLLQYCSCLEEDETCNRKPLRTKTAALPPDDRFALKIVGVDTEYIPGRSYPIQLYSTDGQSSFIAFTIAATGDTMPNEKNQRRPKELSPGRIMSSRNSSIHDTITKDICPETVFEANVLPKTSVEALWQAPPKGNKCVTIYAYVAVKPDVWYSSDGPLSKRICEDHRKNEDMKPPENNDCRVCEEARYELEFEGTWSQNTHQDIFPSKNPELARFSDIVGASHNKDFILYKDNTEATPGLQMLAEQGNTTSLEQEILKQLDTGNVRTIIKATGPSRPSLSTVTSFRTSRQHHFISIAAAIIPSPDWFLGVYNLELCAIDGQWAKRVLLNLYPMDAGTDSGLTFESPNEVTSPPKVILKTKFLTDIPDDKIRPFAKLIVTLVRTYTNPNCTEKSEAPAVYEGSEDSGDGNEFEEPERPYRPASAPSEPVTSPPPPVIDTEVSQCPVSTWEDWLPCEGSCEGNIVKGYQTRFRYFVVDGVEVGKNFEEDEDSAKEVPLSCIQNVPTTDTKTCEEPCEEEDNTESPAEARLGNWKEWNKWTWT